jgi:hypothetical protein
MPASPRQQRELARLAETTEAGERYYNYRTVEEMDQITASNAYQSNPRNRSRHRSRSRGTSGEANKGKKNGRPKQDTPAPSDGLLFNHAFFR